MRGGDNPGGAPEGTKGAGSVFAKVLDAEGEADQRLDHKRREAEQICLAAQAEARRVEDRADRRLQALHQAERTWIRDQRHNLVAAFEAEQRDMAADPRRFLTDAAIHRLARSLAGIDTE